MSNVATHAANKAALDSALLGKPDLSAYEAALAAVPGGKVTVLPGVKPSPKRKGTVAQDAARSKAKTKATVGKAVAKMTGTTKGKPVARITTEWLSSKGKDVAVKDKVKLADGTTVTCIGRWTKRKGEQKIPFITGTTSDGTRKNSPASEVTHSK